MLLATIATDAKAAEPLVVVIWQNLHNTAAVTEVLAFSKEAWVVVSGGVIHVCCKAFRRVKNKKRYSRYNLRTRSFERLDD